MQSKKNFTVTQSRNVFRLFMVIFVFFAVLIFFEPPNTAMYVIITIIIFIPCLVAMVWLKLLKITVDGDRITVRKRPGVQYSFDVSEIVKVECKTIVSGVGGFVRITIETASKQVFVDSVQDGFDDMAEYILENVDNGIISYTYQDPFNTENKG